MHIVPAARGPSSQLAVPPGRSKGQTAVASTGALLEVKLAHRGKPWAGHRADPGQTAVPIADPGQRVLVLRVAGAWRSGWRHDLAGMANIVVTAPSPQP